MPRQYISKVQVPTGGIYYIKDDEARAQIAQIGNFSRYLGVATDMPTNTSVTVKYIGDTGEETITYTTTSEEPYKLSSGDVVTVSNTTTEPYGEKEYIFNGTGWAELNTVQGLLKAFAYVSQGAATFTPSVTKTGTVAVSSTTLASTAIPATFSTTKVTGATAIKTVNSITTRSDVVIGVSYSKATAATVTVDSSATFNGTVSSVVTGVEQTKNYLVANVGQSTWLTGVSYSKATGGTVTVDSSATFSGIVSSVVTNVTASTSSYRISVPKNIWVTGVSYSKATGATATGTTLSKTTDTIYGASSALKVMTGADSLDKKNISVVSSITAPTASFFNNASVAGEILTFAYSNAVTSVTPTNASVLSSTTGITAGTSSTLISKTFVTDVTVSAEPTITITNTKTAAELTKVASSYMDIVASSTGMSLAYDISVTKSDVAVTVSGSAVTSPTVTITNTKTEADLTKNAATTIPVVSAASGSYSVVTNVSPTVSDVDVTVSGSAVTSPTVTITNTKTAADLTSTTVVSSITASTMYGKVSAYAGGDHTHGVSDTIAVSGNSQTITVDPKTN